jgi:hypothetical protein
VTRRCSASHFAGAGRASSSASSRCFSEPTWASTSVRPFPAQEALTRPPPGIELAKGFPHGPPGLKVINCEPNEGAGNAGDVRTVLPPGDRLGMERGVLETPAPVIRVMPLLRQALGVAVAEARWRPTRTGAATVRSAGSAGW